MRRIRMPSAQAAPRFGFDPGRGPSRPVIQLKCKCGRVLYQGPKPPDCATIQCQGCGRTINARPPEVKKSPEQQ